VTGNAAQADAAVADPRKLIGAAPEVQEWLDQIHAITDTLRGERTAFRSPVFPMEYIRVTTLETWRRWPELMVEIDKVVSAEDIGETFRRPGLGVNSTHFYCLACSPVPGNQNWNALGQPAADDPWRAQTVMNFFRRTASAWRADGFTTAFAAGGSIRPYPKEVTQPIADSARSIGDIQLKEFRRSLAAISQYTFLLNIECRIAIGDSGPYPLPNDRVLVVRELADMGESWRPWSQAAASVRYPGIVMGLVIRPGVSIRITDIATTFTTPGSLLDHVEAVALFSSDGAGNLTPLQLAEFSDFAASLKDVNRALYRNLTGLSYSEKIAAGTMIYFSMLRPWARVAGLEDSFDWDVPRASLPVLKELGINYVAEERTAI
jgi:hypothetical protein